MRFTFSSQNHARDFLFRFQKAFNNHTWRAISLTEAQLAFAKITGYASWPELTKSGIAVPYNPDQQIDIEAAARDLADTQDIHFESALAALNVAFDIPDAMPTHKNFAQKSYPPLIVRDDRFPRLKRRDLAAQINIATLVREHGGHSFAQPLNLPEETRENPRYLHQADLNGLFGGNFPLYLPKDKTIDGYFVWPILDANEAERVIADLKSFDETPNGATQKLRDLDFSGADENVIPTVYAASTTAGIAQAFAIGWRRVELAPGARRIVYNIALDYVYATPSQRGKAIASAAAYPLTVSILCDIDLMRARLGSEDIECESLLVDCKIHGVSRTLRGQKFLTALKTSADMMMIRVRDDARALEGIIATEWEDPWYFLDGCDAFAFIRAEEPADRLARSYA